MICAAIILSAFAMIIIDILKIYIPIISVCSRYRRQLVLSKPFSKIQSPLFVGFAFKIKTNRFLKRWTTLKPGFFTGRMAVKWRLWHFLSPSTLNHKTIITNSRPKINLIGRFVGGGERGLRAAYARCFAHRARSLRFESLSLRHVGMDNAPFKIPSRMAGDFSYHSVIPFFPQKVTLHLRCSLVNALTTLATNFCGTRLRRAASYLSLEDRRKAPCGVPFALAELG